MTTLRLRLLVLIVWLFVFGNIERVYESINIASFVYVYTVAIAASYLLVGWFRKTALIWTATPLIALFFLIKAQLGYALVGQALPITITELCAISITIYLSRTLAGSVDIFEEAATQTMMIHLNDPSIPFEEGQHRIFQEMKRSRRFQRPVSLVSMVPSTESWEQSTNAILEEIQRDTAKKYIRSRIAELMKLELRDCDIIARSNGHFILMLPEVSRTDVSNVIERIQSLTKSELGVTLKAGISTFPQEEITLTGLVERAELDMQKQEHQEVVEV